MVENKEIILTRANDYVSAAKGGNSSNRYKLSNQLTKTLPLNTISINFSKLEPSKIAMPYI